MSRPESEMIATAIPSSPEEQTHEGSTQSPAKSSPRTHVDSQPLPTDSLVTVSLSDTNTEAGRTPRESVQSDAGDDEESKVEEADEDTAGDSEAESSRPNSIDMFRASPSAADTAVDGPNDGSLSGVEGNKEARGSQETLTSSRSRSDSGDSTGIGSVLDSLDKQEEAEARDEVSDKSTALLLARLERENNALAIDPKSYKSRARSQSRPPSIQQLKKLYQQDGLLATRFSLLPLPVPTIIEFWGAIVQDYPQTVQRAPTYVSNRIQEGIPDALRGAVWVSMAGARDKAIEEQYDTLCNESSPYEAQIGKDLARTFPKVDMFKDPEGEGQRMLGSVLKCYSLYDEKIGYCQGLGFLVGSLLMKMSEKEAFCVLVRLMEDYDLRSCYLPDLSGLHLRIFQYQRLLHQHVPRVAKHLDELQVNPTYLTQWFLSFFATTCPPHLLFRIYDVLFAEGASETIMRVALAVMQRHEKKILSFTELEDVMDLLLTRKLWDPYGYNSHAGDELVKDFTGFTTVVTRETLQALQISFKEANENPSSSAGFFPGVQSSAAKFLGRLWAPSASSIKSGALSPPPTSTSRPGSFLRRTPSKQSLASTLNSVEGVAVSNPSITSTFVTEATTVSRDFSGDEVSIKSQTESMTSNIRITVSKDKDADQINELMMVISQLQNENQRYATQLKKKEEDCNDDHRLVRELVDHIRKNPSTVAASTSGSKEARRKTTVVADLLETHMLNAAADPSAEIPATQLPEEVANMLDRIDTRFSPKLHHRKSSQFETKEALRESLATAKTQLADAYSMLQQLNQKITDYDTKQKALQEDLTATRKRLQKSTIEQQRLEKALQDLRREQRKVSLPWSDSSSGEVPSLTRSDTADTVGSTSSSGLREFKLGRANTSALITTISTTSSPSTSTPSPVSGITPMWSKRASSLSTQAILSTANHEVASEETLLTQLAQTKSEEASAKEALALTKTTLAVKEQELEEMRAKFANLRQMVAGQGKGHRPGLSESGLLTPPAEKERPAEKEQRKSSTPTLSAGGGWFWGKRSVSATTITTSS